jgi:hypothetical protein
MTSIAAQLNDALIRGVVPEEYRPFVVNEDKSEVRILSAIPCHIRAYNEDESDPDASIDWNVVNAVAVSPDKAARISRGVNNKVLKRGRRSGKHDHQLKLYVAERNQLFHVDLGSTYVYDGQTLIRAYP